MPVRPMVNQHDETTDHHPVTVLTLRPHLTKVNINVEELRLDVHCTIDVQYHGIE